ncbi:HEPN domain-containing protein [Patescibacteria group bacterium]|nr:HEPN domain-containing protein [Patescibacteria group bacterium]
MRENNSKKLAKEWFKIGDNEFDFAKAGFEELNAFYPQICFLFQQAVEKYLKGFLVYYQKKFPKIHDLTELAKFCSKIDKEFLEFLPKTDILSQYYLTSRYPLEYREAGKKEAQEALEIAEEIINIIEIKLRDF